MKALRLLKGLAVCAALACAASAALAETWPTRTVRFVVPFPAGTATDLAARTVGQELQVKLGHPFVIDNRPGAGGSIAVMEVVRAAPDGYTLLFSSNSAISSNVALFKSLPYDPNRDFTPIAGVGLNALVLMVKGDFPTKDLAGFIAYAKAHPGKLTAGYGSSSSQVSISMLARMAGLDVVSVPYKGITQAVNDLLGGSIDFTFVDIGNAIAQAKRGALRGLAVTSLAPNALEPSWPPVATTLPGYDITAWFAVVGPAGVPADVVNKIHADITRVLAAPEMTEKFGAIGLVPQAMGPVQLKAFIADEIGKWQRLVKEADIEPQ